MLARATAPPAYSATVTPLPQAPRYIRFHGKTILRGTGFLRGTLIKCPEGHVMNRRSAVLEDDILFCDAKLGQGQAKCGALIYLLAVPARGEEKRRFWLADCTREEWHEIERLQLDVDGVLHYFGAAFDR